ncbi:isochorismate synthase [Massilia sp. BJB1822]|uniref:isochorismate synthase n=1 Tax=Massilia sp. BJB1822 TaxID=2744470 RepID=UPI00159424C7|nr:isochorismate synthase [Massilia sp. BJB1822]NVE00060.1 isochorismate synthase [Massilia sp. BJB1822]
MSTASLLELYRPDAALFLATPRHTLLAAGARSRLQIEGGAGQWQALAGRARALLGEQAREFGAARAVLVGALPFDERLPARLVVPETLHWSGPLGGVALPAPSAQALGTGALRELPSGAEYVAAVEQALAQIRAGELRKVVLARALEMQTEAAPDVAALLANLVRRNQGAYAFAAQVGEQNQPRTLIGASPELLVSRRGRAVLANPLAGSAPRNADPELDRRAGAALLASAKDRREHAFVVEAVAASLRPFCSEISVPAEPVLMQTATMWHLSTELRGQLRDSATSALELATALHPTPAICGTPTAPALAAIRALEGFERGYYAGLVGWSDASGDGEWIVTIRCAEVAQRQIRLYAGAGIVDGSQAQAELDETSAKFRTVLTALGIAP